MSWLPLYHILTWFALPFALAYHWYRSISRGRKAAFGERLGFISSANKALLSGKPLLWIHAVSVGEVIAARPLLKGLRGEYPGHQLLLSVTTETGRGVAERDKLADLVIYFPFDTGFAVRRLLDLAKPEAIVVMETEIWPMFILEASRRQIPLFLANGRISSRSFPRYRRFSRFFRPILNRFSWLGMQSDQDRERIVAIGAPPDRTVVTGNLKYDIPFAPVGLDEREQLRKDYRIRPGVTVFSAASTHPGEEGLLLPVYRRLLQRFPELLLALVPRHPERGGEVAAAAAAAGFKVLRRSALPEQGEFCEAGELLLVDTVGELMQIYALSDLAFVGGSLVPTGGHNLLEPASRGIPFIFGPYMDNFREIATLALEYGAGVQVSDSQGVEDAAAEFLATSELRQVIGSNGLKLLRDSGGATRRQLELLAGALSP